MQITPQLRRLAARQHGLITIDQARGLGVSRDAWYRAVRTGRLVGVAPNVAALPGAAASLEQRVLAAVLAVGEGSMASHRSAAYLWGAEVAPTEPVDLTTPDRNRRVVLPWVRLHTPIDLGDLRPVRRRGIPSTNPLRILLDLGQVAPESVLPALERFMVDGSVSRRAVVAALGRHGRKGRHGVGALRDAVDTWAIGDKPPDSTLELVMARLLEQYDLPPAIFHAILGGHEVDFAIAAGRVVIECDGWESHGRSRTQFERDRVRDATLAAAGWVVLRSLGSRSPADRYG
ncbi:MAG TPA: type IV toxin-antitoxin system AbiEi family antitoxin domain-containing protein, partial [Acidimicrobiales bacterium]